MSVESEAADMTSSGPVTKLPRSHRVGMASPPSDLSLSGLISSQSPPTSAESPPSSLSFPPLLPPRSPLRPPARSITDSSANSVNSARSSRTQSSLKPTTPPSENNDFAAIVEPSPSPSFQMRNHLSYASVKGMMDSGSTSSEDGLTSKPVPIRPESPLSISLEDESASSSSSVAQQPMSKRHHALHELLSSERAYASDLALIREVHIPLALGHNVPLHNVPPSPPDSSASSSRTVSTASDSSTSSLGPPMTQEDTKIIFNNVAELALFSDFLCEELETALGSVVEGGQGEDCVGQLFLKIIPELERPYKYYITRHPSALAHLQALPQTPALTAYLSNTQHIASSLSHAWDLASLLIKPVQRLLKYPLLLTAIIEETPDGHPDKENLKLARSKLEEVARNVNEGRRRAEVVKDVLSSKKKPLNVTVSATVNLSKMKSLRQNRAIHADGNGEAAEVERMQAELKRIDIFTQQFARNVVDWARMMSNVVRSLRTWALSFGKVIGLSSEQGSEAFEAFLAVVERQLMPLCVDLEAVITERLLKEIAHLLTTMNKPMKLLSSMNEQEPFHYHLLTMSVSAKNRPPASLLEASNNYLALRGQLAAELPQYLTLMHTGLAATVRTLAIIQTEFWRDVKDRWGDLWEMLRVDGELNAGHAETVNVWLSRWSDVDEVMAALNITQTKRLYHDPPARSVSYVQSMLSSLDPSHSPNSKSRAGITNSATGHSPSEIGATSNMTQYVSAPFALTPSRSRSRGLNDETSSRRSINRRTSAESMRSGKSRTAAKSPPRRRTEDYIPAIPNLPRTKSMPLPSDKHTGGNAGAGSSNQFVEGSATGGSPEFDDRERDRGRPSRHSSYKRKSVEQPRRPTDGRQRSGSIKSITSFFTPSSNATNNNKENSNIASTNTQNFHEERSPERRPLSAAQRDSWVTKRAKYVCQVIHPCKPPAAVSYFSFPFFTLLEGDLYEVLQEAGHPSIHPKLPLYVDDGEDCLLLCRDENGNVGWALASFLEPLSLSG